MNECLVTKLKASVNDDSLPMLNALRIEVSKQNVDTKNNVVTLSVSEIRGGVDIVSFSHPFYVNDVAYYEYHVALKVTIRFANADYSVYVKNVNNINGINGITSLSGDGKFKFNLGELKNNDILTTIIMPSNTEVYGELRVNAEILTNVNLSASISKRGLVKVDLANLRGSSRITNLGLGFQNITGSIVNLANNISITSISLGGNTFSFSEIEDFAKAQVSAGRITGNVNIFANFDDGDTITQHWGIEYSSDFENGYRIYDI